MAEELQNRRILTRPWKRVLHFGGYALMLIAIGYLINTLATAEFMEAFASLGPAGLVSVVATVTVYVGLLTLLARAWTTTAAGSFRVEWPLAVKIYGIGVVTKYVPGAVFQYASRHVLGARAGWTHQGMLRATLAEAALHIVSAVLAGGALVVFGAWIGGAVALSLGAAIGISAKRPLFCAAGLQLCAFTGHALCVYWLAAGLLSLPFASQMVGIYMVAWILSYVFPFAPGGIGIRESTFLFLAGSFGPSAELAVLVMLARATTTLGDACFGLLAYGLTLRSRLKRQASG